jgi:hypothetical protein
VAFEFAEMTSPREYNFTTDRVFCRVAFADVEKMLGATKPDTLARIIRERFTSRSGFISFYSAEFADWMAKPREKWDANECGTLLIAFLADHADTSRRDVCERIADTLAEHGVFDDALAEALDWEALKKRLAANAAKEEGDNADA